MMSTRNAIYPFLPCLITGVILSFTVSQSHARQFEVEEAVERDEALWASLTEVSHEVQFGLGWLSDDAFQFGRFNGLTDEGPFLDLQLDLHQRPNHDADEMRYWRIKGRNLGIESRTLHAEQGVQGRYSTFFEFQQMPHYQWESVGIEHSGAGSHTLTSDAPRDHDVRQERQRFSLGAAYRPQGASNWKMSSEISRENHDGTRLRGFERQFSAGAGSVAPEVVDSYTDEFRLLGQFQGGRFNASAGYHLSAFSQEDRAEMQVDGDTFALEPDNHFHRISLSGNFRPADRTQLSGNLHIGRMLQNEGFSDADEDVLLNGNQVNSLDGKISTTALNLRGSHRFSNRTRFRAAIRHDDRDNRTEVHEVAGRSTRPLSFTRTRISMDGDHRLNRRTRLTAGIELDDYDRDYGDRLETDTTTFYSQLRTSLRPGLNGGLRIEFSEQSGSIYDATRNNPVPEELRNYDVADRDRQQFTAFITYMPSFMPTISFSGRSHYIEDDFTASVMGRTAAERWSNNAEVSWVPTDKVSLHAFVGWDQSDITLAGDGWTADQTMEALTSGFGGEWTIRPEQLRMGFDFTRLDSRTRMDYANGSPTRHPTLESDFSESSLYGSYQRSRSLAFEARYMYRRFTEHDWALGETFVTATPDERDYSVHLIMFSARYHF